MAARQDTRIVTDEKLTMAASKKNSDRVGVFGPGAGLAGPGDRG
jgi:hypothetical protein